MPKTIEIGDIVECIEGSYTAGLKFGQFYVCTETDSEGRIGVSGINGMHLVGRFISMKKLLKPPEISFEDAQRLVREVVEFCDCQAGRRYEVRNSMMESLRFKHDEFVKDRPNVEEALGKIAAMNTKEIHREMLPPPEKVEPEEKELTQLASDDDLVAFALEEGGAFWWVTAYSPEHARALLLVHLMDTYGWDQGIHDEALSATVEELTAAELDSISILTELKDNGEWEGQTLREVMESGLVGPEVLTCSEW